MTNIPMPTPEEKAHKKAAVSPLRAAMLDFASSPLAMIGFVVMVAMVLAAVFAPWITPQNPYDLSQLSIMDNNMRPGSESFGGMTYWLGTDPQGRDMLSAIIYGLRMSLLVAVTATLCALAIGMAMGITAAYFGGRVDTLIMRVVDLQLSFPAILVALILLAILGKGVDKVIIALVIVQWAYYARTVRGSALVERQRDYIAAARGLGLGHARVMFRHLLPNTLPPLIVVATVQIAQAIALEATLSFLGVGVPVTEPSLGLLIANGYSYLLSGAYWISVYPGVALLIAIVAINLVGDQLRDVLNPRLRR
ncbi:ABC transporter permease [Roseinatronobacter sp. NSM]|uniref:ABC transporter permease n=1 Tax=Roseinatronobacter sp. NSM TaxID=3457785 RepID=UPI004036A955